MRRNDPNNQNNSAQIGRLSNKVQSENSRIIEENRGRDFFIFRYTGKNLTAETYDF